MALDAELTPEEENRAMKIYLAGGEGKGYDPVGKEDRLRKEYGPGWRKIQKALNDYLEPLIKRPESWTDESARESAQKMSVILEENFPWFDETARQLMLGCFLYEWK